VLREMTHPNGGCYSSQDADVDGQEGRYYLWTPGEIRQVLGEENGSLVGRYFGVAEGGNFEGRSVLHAPGDPAGFAAGTGDRLGDVETVMTQARLKLLEARGRRPKPRLDDKMLASWNGLMLQALAEASGVLGREDYLKAAVANASFVVSDLMKGNALMHSYKDGVSGIPGYLEDYASVIRGVLCLHEVTFEQCWLQTAFDLADAMVRRFSDEKNPGLLYDTGPDQGHLFIRPRDTSDSVKPCGGSSATEVLLRVSRITDNGSYAAQAVAMLGLVRDPMLRHPLASGNWLCALDLHLSDPDEIVFVGTRDDPSAQTLLAAIYGHFLPAKILVGIRPGDPASCSSQGLAKDRGMIEGRPTVHVCRGRTCLPPATHPDELGRLLQR
jgi:uncharacterized protein YyaL (SSP411 family)